MTDSARRRQEMLRGLMVELMDLQDRAGRLDRDMAGWRKRWEAAYHKIDDALDLEIDPR